MTALNEARDRPLRDAGARAQRDGKGFWERSDIRSFGRTPYLNGAAIGLYYQHPLADYHRQIDELAAGGFAHLSLVFSAFLDDHRAVRVRMDLPATVRDERLVETIRYAKGRGLSVMLLPIVLLRDSASEHWRGTLAPRDRRAFWSSYEEFVTHYLDIAEAEGVELFSVGSELGSMERDTWVWRRIIANARGRYRGLLTYSVNWDHLQGPQFLGELDVVGLTGYFSLTGDRDPSRGELVAGWQSALAGIEKKIAGLNKPVVITELGYASQDGTNTNPWNYLVGSKRIDLEEQADCFWAFIEASRDCQWLRGAYFYDYFDAGGENDPSYSPRGKPAWKLWRQWAAIAR